MYCNNCGSEIPEGNSFCANCGTPLEGAAPQPPAPEPPGTPAPVAPPVAPPTPTPAPPPGVQAQPPVPPPGPPPPAFSAPATPKKSRKVPVLLIAGVAALLIVVAVVLILVFTVFKDNTGKARELVKKGDKYMEAVQTEADKGNDALSSLMNNIETIDTSAAFKEQADEVRSAIESAQEELKSAEKEYKEVESLSGVEQYKTYTKTVLELIALDFKIQDTTNKFLDYIEGQYEAVEAGQQVSSDEIRQTTSEYVEDVNKMAEEANDLRDKADKLRSDNKLY